MRSYMRKREVLGETDEQLPGRVGLTGAELERMYRLLAIANYEDRYVIPQAHAEQGAELMREQGACDLSYSLPGSARFRVNIFIQRGTCAIVMRVIPNAIPDFASLHLPPQLAEIVNLKNGIVLITGPTGSGKSSTMAATRSRAPNPNSTTSQPPGESARRDCFTSRA